MKDDQCVLLFSKNFNVYKNEGHLCVKYATIRCQKPQTPLNCSEVVYSLEMYTTEPALHKVTTVVSSILTVKLPLNHHLRNVFKLLECFLFLGTGALTITIFYIGTFGTIFDLGLFCINEKVVLTKNYYCRSVGEKIYEQASYLITILAQGSVVN